jgi:nucleoside-diphosphate-sugar epimerase
MLTPKIKITGANSFVGKSFIENSRYDNINEICLINNKVEDINLANEDVVLHVAAIVHQTEKIAEEKYFEVNCDLALEVAKKAKQQGIKHFVFLSTVKVYGDYHPEKGVWSENSECEPNDSYGKSKYAAEKALIELIDDSFTVSIIRPPLIYGIGVKANMLSIIKLIDKFPLLPLGKIENKRSFTSIENLVQLIDRVIEKRVSGVFLAMDDKTTIHFRTS